MPKRSIGNDGDPPVDPGAATRSGDPEEQNGATKRWQLLESSKEFRPPALDSFRMHYAAGKGGIGKTAIAIMIASYCKSIRRDVDVFDLCVANPSSRRYLKLGNDRNRGELDKDLIGEVIREEIYPLLQSKTVLGDLGASVEVPFLDFLAESDLSKLFGEEMVLHVPIGPLDSVGTARSIAERAPDTPIVLYLNHRDRELRMVVRNPERRKLLDDVITRSNVVGVIEIPDLSSALAICSRISETPYDAQTSQKLSPIERAMCQGAMRRIADVLKPLDAWLK